ncbi:restriction endonuclease [Vampirovibrio sp.]|uniref:restriction endonuclease n=1 Tax=Vampirovibrio sp. TaxID=2717857 RepID=UPI003593466D
MAKILSPHVIELTKDACLKAFWRKPALRLFLKQHGIADAMLATWAEDESKRVFLARLFEKLIGLKSNNGYRIIFDMACSLAEMKHFPDLENWEDTPKKISEANKAVSRLKLEVGKAKEVLTDEKEALERRRRSEEERQKAIAASTSLENLGSGLKNLVMQIGTIEAGLTFEKWFYEMVNFHEIPCRLPYKDTRGRQIDGSLTLDGTTFLVETKFTKDPVGSQDIDIFLSKIRTKADNTMGILISMAGFNSGALETASHDRTPLILLDHAHFYTFILPGTMSLTDVIRRVSRHASQSGEAFLAAKDF